MAPGTSIFCWLSLAVLTTAQVNTYVALPLDSYTVTVADRPTPVDDEVIVQTDAGSGDINIFPGKNRVEAINKAREECGGVYDEKCFNAISQAWGHRVGGDSNGLQKRLDPLLVGGGLIGAVFTFISKYLYDSFGDNPLRLPAGEIPKLWIAPQPTNVYKTATDDPNAVTVTVPSAPASTGDGVPSIKVDAEGIAEVTLPESLVNIISEALGTVNCKREGRKVRRQGNDDAWRDCLILAGAQLAKDTDYGGTLERFQGIQWDVAGGDNVGIPLPEGFDQVPDLIEDVTDLLSLFGEVTQGAREVLGRISLILSNARFGANIPIGNKMTIPLQRPKTKPDDDNKTNCTGVYFCDQECGGRDLSIPGRTIDTGKPAPSKVPDSQLLWTCKGISSCSAAGLCTAENAPLKGCDCMLTMDWDGYEYDGLSVAVASFDRIASGGNFDWDRYSDPNPPEDLTKLPEYDLHCSKDDPDIRNNRDRWSWTKEHLALQRIDEFCSQELDQFSGTKYGPGPTDKDEYFEGWNSYRYQIDYNDAERPPKAYCVEALTAVVEKCNIDPTLDQHKLKWGGRVVEKKTKRAYHLIPTRMHAQKQPITNECHTWANRGQKNDKGWNRQTLPDLVNDQMMKLQCFYAMKDMGWMDHPLECGPTANGPFYQMELTGRYEYESLYDCWDANFACVLDSFIDQAGVVLSATHNLPLTKCWFNMPDYN